MKMTVDEHGERSLISIYVSPVGVRMMTFLLLLLLSWFIAP